MVTTTPAAEDSPCQPRTLDRENAVSDLSIYFKLMRQRTLSDASSKTQIHISALSSNQDQDEEDYFNASMSHITSYDPTAEQLRLELDVHTRSSPPAVESSGAMLARSGRRAADYAKRRSEYLRRMAESCITQNCRRLKGGATVQRTRRHCIVHNTALTRPVVDKLRDVVRCLDFRTCWSGWLWSKVMDDNEMRCDVEQQRMKRKASLEAAEALDP